MSDDSLDEYYNIDTTLLYVLSSTTFCYAAYLRCVLLAAAAACRCCCCCCCCCSAAVCSRLFGRSNHVLYEYVCTYEGFTFSRRKYHHAIRCCLRYIIYAAVRYVVSYTVCCIKVRIGITWIPGIVYAAGSTYLFL